MNTLKLPSNRTSSAIPPGFKDGGPGKPPVPIDHYDAPSMFAQQGPRRFHAMIKPGGCACNLDCSYCFYLSKATLPGGPGPGRMSNEILERFIQ